MISSYAFNGAQEYCLIRGSDTDIKICIIPPLFDEMNRLRRTLVEVTRLLENKGIGTIMPDLPGCNESSVPLGRTSFSDWKQAIIAVCLEHNATHIASLRGGCLLDDAVPILPRWRFAEISGSKLLRTMIRTRIASDKEDGVSNTTESLMAIGKTEGLSLAGNSLSADMLSQFEKAVPVKGDNVHYVSLGQNDGQIAGKPLWLRAEPDHDPVLAKSMATDLSRWCA